jgi:type I restriction enzyme S subunit
MEYQSSHRNLSTVAWLSNRFLANTLVAKPVLERALRRTKTTAGQVNLTLEVCRDLAIPLPPHVEQEAIAEGIEQQLSTIDHLESDLDAKLTSAEALRQSILRHAFSGKLVQQDPNDESPSELLIRIVAEREQCAREVAANRLNGQKPRRAPKLGGKAVRTAKKKKETDHGRIADR